MNIAIWIAIAMVAFVMPATALTKGGAHRPDAESLRRYAQSAGLPVTDAVSGPVVERIRRRQRGMRIGGLIAIVAGTVGAIIFGEQDSWGGALIMVLAGVGTSLGGAWAIVAHRPSPDERRPLIARTRSAELADYLTFGERFGYWAVPGALVVAAAGGAILLLQLPEPARESQIPLGLLATGLALLLWGVSLYSVRRVLGAPARSGSDLELAWDDAERADGLRQLMSLAVVTSGIAIFLWGVLLLESLTTDGFYRQHTELSTALGLIALAFFMGLIALIAAGPIGAWLSGRRRGHEQRRLWPNGVSAA
ncbi:hypothetical protein [Gulosibacter sp. 10]|uniref:hypothetical protein n=1 Tax=Gulosibacter sp. 10 TaxID=1255570 RepID=UPI00097ECD5A|nr:hypothetical protein [Gulosibacter sp. 10]SJM68198.1 hypothetical protein FM112_13220 [Gulosibacter sp. 10]